MTAFKIKNELPFLGENLRAFKDGFFDDEETEDSEEQTEDDEENSEADEREEVADEPEEVVVTVHSATQTAEKYFAEKKKLGFFDLGSPLADRILQFSTSLFLTRSYFREFYRESFNEVLYIHHLNRTAPRRSKYAAWSFVFCQFFNFSP